MNATACPKCKRPVPHKNKTVTAAVAAGYPPPLCKACMVEARK